METGEAKKEGTPLTRPIRIGTMGWSYADWSGPFYPAESASRDALALYAQTFDAVEIDSTFYGTPRDTHVTHWDRATPAGFVFCPKVPRLITHDMGLQDAREPLTHFVEVMGRLGPKRGPMLIQMPPSFTLHDLPALQGFLPLLPALPDPMARFAIEFRHRSLLTPEVFALLKEFGVALVAADYVGMPRQFRPTTDFVYLRLVGKHGAFTHHRELQADRGADLDRWAEALRENQARYAVAYAFCNNDFEGYAPSTGNRLKERLDLPTKEPPPPVQGSLF